MGDSEQTAYLAGDDAAPVTRTERMRLDTVRAVLADRAVWAQPDPSLQESIVAAITAAKRSTHPVPARRKPWIGHTLLGVAAALIIAAGVTVGITGHNTTTAATFAARLTGTPLAAGATGQVTLTQTAGGWQIALSATGLPRRDSGSFYEAWLKNAVGVLVPIGTFNEPVQVTLWAGVSPVDFPTLTITAQEANGNPASSGRVVLKGVTHRIG